ncbi:metalloregulator ArsR/SmtB family transcription factor [Actinoplanes sp. TFC3]|uniref:metalloregulator ArsR/SmtB family transcription factor n=1 Tax=Actinoplanes sp. TFC3 TaxID=1710355 RepID=UPI0008359F58|nr:metalloregulator ArsR/SmtB family transcription factor [Actinoplanes sp. TFC3]
MSTGSLQTSPSTLERAVVVLRGMAYEHRLHILVLLQQGEQTPAALAEAIAADSTSVAHHLRFLKDARLIRRQRRGRNVFYALRGQSTTRLIGEVMQYAEESA